MRRIFLSSALLLAMIPAGVARAQTPPPSGTPPPEAKAMVEAKAIADAPTLKNKDDALTITGSLGGQSATGNARTLAGTAGSVFDMRRSEHAFLASVLGNYSEGRPPNAPHAVASAENLQARARYDFFLTDRLSAFAMATGRYDKFQGLDFRLNLDPGLKYILFKDDEHSVWLEGGYDFQYDIRRNASRVALDANKQPVLDANGAPVLLDKTFADHSARLFAGYKISFNKDVTGSLGLEFLQGFRDSDTGGKRSRVNVETLVAAKLMASFSLGVGFTARYDSQPLPGKENLDTTSQATLIYSFAEEKKTVPPPAPAPPVP